MVLSSITFQHWLVNLECCKSPWISRRYRSSLTKINESMAYLDESGISTWHPTGANTSERSTPKPERLQPSSSGNWREKIKRWLNKIWHKHRVSKKRHPWHPLTLAPTNTYQHLVLWFQTVFWFHQTLTWISSVGFGHPTGPHMGK